LTNTEENIKKALILKDDEKFEESIEILENLFKKHPDSEIIKKNLVNVLFAYGGHLNDEFVLEYQKAIEIFKKIIEIEPNNYRVLYNIGIAYFNLGNMENALKACNEAIKIKPDYQHCYYNIGLIYETMEDWKKALRYYNKALEIDPNFTYALHSKHLINQKLDFLRKATPEPQQEKKPISEQLKSLLIISKRLKIQMIQDLLNIDNKKLLEILIEWGDKYQFEIDGDFLNINKETLPDLLKDLDNFENKYEF
jgi:tetratricopeptide (TPR) repeat protein